MNGGKMTETEIELKKQILKLQALYLILEQRVELLENKNIGV